MLDNKILVSDLLHTSSLVTRETAKSLFAVISNMPDSNIILDFSKVDFVSRSFFDEINSQRRKLSFLGKALIIINLKDSLEQLQQIVQNTLDQKVTGFFSSTANAELVSM